MTYKRGDIVLVYFPHTDFKKVKKRPALVVQANNLVTGFSNLLLAEISSNLTRQGQPCRVFVSQKSGVGLQQDSVILCDMIMTVQSKLIYKKIGSMLTMHSIDNALKAVFDL